MFVQPLDIMNEACRLLGQPRQNSFDASNNVAKTIASAYDVARLAELETNLWRFASRRVILRALGIDSVLWTPPTWASGNYSAGAVVSFTSTSGPYSGQTLYWQLKSALSPSSLAPDSDPAWTQFTGPLALDLYNTGETTSNSAFVYEAGEIVLTPAAWSSVTTYAKNTVVARESAASVWLWYVSLTNGNLNHDPNSDTTNWVQWTGQGRGNNSYGVTATNSPIPLTGTYSMYLSLYNNNNDNPLSGTTNWLNLGGTVTPLLMVWPIGTGPRHELRTMNVFRLPNGYLKRAPTDPKENMTPYLGAASGTSPEDYVLEGDYLISMDPGPIMIRFVADIKDVPEMNTLFCKGLGAAIAANCDATINQSDNKNVLADRKYTEIIRRARTANAIEIGPITQVENRYVTVRF